MLVIEHNLDVIKWADWIVDMGPEGGEKGGYIIAEGTPEEIMRSEKTPPDISWRTSWPVRRLSSQRRSLQSWLSRVT